MKNWISSPYRSLVGRSDGMSGPSVTKRTTRRETLLCEALEGRVVMSHGGFGGPGFGAGFGGPPMGDHFGGGSSLVGTLTTLGVVTSGDPGFPGGRNGFPGSTSTTASTQLDKDLAALQAALKTLAAKSAVTIADLNNLASDSQAIAAVGFRPDSTALQKAVSELATATASGADASQAKADFTAVFAGSSVSQATIDKAYSDLVQTVQDSHVTAADLETIAADQNAVQTDVASTPGGGFDHGRGGDLLGTLATLGVVTSGDPGFPGGRDGFHGVPSSTSTTTTTQLDKDLAALQAALKGLAAKSGVTVADVNNLMSDSQAIAAAGFRPDATALQKAVSELATATASGADASQAKADFTAVFAGSSVSQATIDKAYADLVQAIQDSHVSTADLQTITADRQAVQNDLGTTTSGSTGGATTGTPAGSRAAGHGGRHRFHRFARRGRSSLAVHGGRRLPPPAFPLSPPEATDEFREDELPPTPDACPRPLETRESPRLAQPLIAPNENRTSD